MVAVSEFAEPAGPQRVAVVIAAYDDKATIGATVRACYAIPDVDLIVVVDDGSNDDMGQAARSAGAVVVRHSVPRGRASALETGVKVVAMRDRLDWPARHILFLDPNLGDSAIEASALVDAVNSGLADCAIGVVPKEQRFGRGPAEKTAHQAVRALTGWYVTDPLSSDRCMTREAVNEIMPFSNGLSVDVGMTVDLISAGFSVVEIPCAFEPRPRTNRRRDKHRVPSRGDIWWTLRAKRLLSRGAARNDRVPRDLQSVGVPYRLGGHDADTREGRAD